MPSSVYNTTPIYKPTESKKRWFGRNRRKWLILIGLVTFAAVMAYITTKNQISIQNPFRQQNTDKVENVVNTATGELTDETLNNISEVTIDEIREASNSTGINPLESPSLSDEETSKTIYQKIGNNDPQNYVIGFSEFGISEPYLEINKGDMVTWTNNSEVPMNVIGDGWQSQIPRDPGDQFSYGFIFSGEYKYTINDTITGTILVK